MKQDLIDFDRLQSHLADLKAQWNDAKKPFHYLVYDNFFTPEAAEQLLAAYPDVTTGNWDGTTYINQKNKFALTKFGDEHPLLQRAFDVGRLGDGHRLHRDGRPATDRHVAHHDLAGLAALGRGGEVHGLDDLPS